MSKIATSVDSTDQFDLIELRVLPRSPAPPTDRLSKFLWDHDQTLMERYAVLVALVGPENALHQLTDDETDRLERLLEAAHSAMA